VRLESELRFVARLHLMQLVLRVERDHGARRLDRASARRHRQRGDESAGPQLQVDDVTVARRARRRLSRSHFALSSCARICATCAYSPFDVRAEPLLHLALAGDRLLLSRARLRFGAPRGRRAAGSGREVLSACSRSNFVPAPAPPARDTARRPSRELDPCGISADRAAACSIAPFVSVTFACAPLIRSPGASFCDPIASGELRLQRVHLQLVRGRVDTKQHVAILDRPVTLLDRTSITRAADLGDDQAP
jgi:hypothetical protein